MRFGAVPYVFLAVMLREPSPPNPLSLKGEGEEKAAATSHENGHGDGHGDGHGHGHGDGHGDGHGNGHGDGHGHKDEDGHEDDGEPIAKTPYPIGALHSPMDSAVVRRLKAVLAKSEGRTNVFAKVGDSLTVNSYFLGCFNGKDVRLDKYKDLEETRAFFTANLVERNRSSFDRSTLAAKVCWSSSAVIGGDPSPLAQEIKAINPAFAVVLIGTNDTYPTGVALLEKKLVEIVDYSLDHGVVPLLSTLPHRRDSSQAKALVPRMNEVIRTIAQDKQVPLMDLYTALADLPRQGLGKDGIHLTAFENGIGRGCWLDERALQKGINRRNLLTLEALDRARRFLLENEPPEPTPDECPTEAESKP